MKPLRILWICSHRTHRYEEVSALLRAGAEVVPISAINTEFPNAIEPGADSDPWYPRWQDQCSLPAAVLSEVRAIDFYRDYDKLSDAIKTSINEHFNVILVASFTPILRELMRWFRGFLILRAFGGYGYSSVMRPWTLVGHHALNEIGHSNRYIWCPILPYLSEVEDRRVAQNEVFVPAFVSRGRLEYEWRARDSEPFACEVISLIEQHRSSLYGQFLEVCGNLPLRIYGQNSKDGALRDDPRIIGTLPDTDYYRGIAGCRLMLYHGLRSKYHLHYHPLEALMMRVPVIFFEDGAIAHHARYNGVSDEELRSAGMVRSSEEAVRMAEQCLADVEVAIDLSKRQEDLRTHFRPDVGDAAWRELVLRIQLKLRYESLHGARPEPASTPKHRLKALISTTLRGLTG